MTERNAKSESPTIPTLAVPGISLTLFVAGVLGLSALSLVPRVVDLPAFVADGVLLLIASFSPIVVAGIVIWRAVPQISVRHWLRNGLRWRVWRGWFAIATLGPAALALAAVAALSLSGRPGPVLDAAAIASALGIFVLAFIFSLGEEYGWRGFLQAALQERFSAVASALAVGIVWTLWHVPSMLTDETAQASLPILPYLVMTLGVSISFAWLYNSTGGSVLLVSVIHGAFNAAVGTVFLNLPDESQHRFIVILAALVWIVALVLIARFGGSRLAPARDSAVSRNGWH